MGDAMPWPPVAVLRSAHARSTLAPLRHPAGNYQRQHGLPRPVLWRPASVSAGGSVEVSLAAASLDDAGS